MKRKKKNRKMSEEIKKEEKLEEEKILSGEAGEDTSEAMEETMDPKDARIAELEAKVRELEESVAAMKDENLRRAAETENYRKRLRQDKENAVKYANEALIGDLLEPLDNFARAIEAASSGSDFEAMKTGVVMVNDQMLQRLKQNWGLQMIESAPGSPYDPNTMEAYGVQEKEGIEQEEVAIECNKGWLLHGKVLRSAKVFVAKPKK